MSPNCCLVQSWVSPARNICRVYPKLAAVQANIVMSLARMGLGELLLLGCWEHVSGDPKAGQHAGFQVSLQIQKLGQICCKVCQNTQPPKDEISNKFLVIYVSVWWPLQKPTIPCAGTPQVKTFLELGACPSLHLPLPVSVTVKGAPRQPCAAQEWSNPTEGKLCYGSDKLYPGLPLQCPPNYH